MLFNSIDFALFLPIVFLLYWFVWREKPLTEQEKEALKTAITDKNLEESKEQLNTLMLKKNH